MDAAADQRRRLCHAEKENLGIIDHMSNFYAHNPTLMKALGGAALAIALGNMAQRK